MHEGGQGDMDGAKSASPLAHLIPSALHFLRTTSKGSEKPDRREHLPGQLALQLLGRGSECSQQPGVWSPCKSQGTGSMVQPGGGWVPELFFF